MITLRTCLALLSAFCAAGLGTAANAAEALPPTLTKQFAAASMFVGEQTLMTITVANPNAGFQLSGIAFEDPLPAGLAILNPATSTSSCLGSFNQASDGVLVSGVALAQNSSCTISVYVTGTAPGLQVNTTSAVSSSQTADGSAASATILVLAPTGVPTLQTWALVALALLLALTAASVLRRIPTRRR